MMIRFQEELDKIHALERMLERTESGRRYCDLRREIKRRKRDYETAAMYYKKAKGKPWNE